VTSLPEDIVRAVTVQPGTVRQYALERALEHALEAQNALISATPVARAHVQCLAEVSRAWSDLAMALGVSAVAA
jgi:hypothetical protein